MRSTRRAVTASLLAGEPAVAIAARGSPRRAAEVLPNRQADVLADRSARLDPGRGGRRRDEVGRMLAGRNYQRQDGVWRRTRDPGPAARQGAGAHGDRRYRPGPDVPQL